MKKGLWIVGIILFISVRPGHAFSWRDKVGSLWTDKPVQIDGRATEWTEWPLVEVGGMSFRAMNDAGHLYLLIQGANDDGRILLSGRYRQNVTLWFLKPDHKSKAWGINLDFSRAHVPDTQGEDWHPGEMVSFSDLGIAPEMIVPQGLEVSTTTFPTEFAFQADLSSEHARQPIYEIQIPLSMVDLKGRSIFFDVVSSEVTADVKAELQEHESGNQGASQNKNNEGGTQSGSPSGGHGGGHHGRGMGGSGGTHGAAATVDVPKPIHLQLTVSLAKKPRS